MRAHILMITLEAARRHKLSLVVLLTSLLSACQTAVYLGTSPPGAVVKAEGKELGTTPMALTADKLPTAIAGGQLLNLEKPGYKRVSIWIPDGIRGLDISLNLQPFEVRADEAVASVTETASRIELYRLTWDLIRSQSQVLVERKEDPQIKGLLKDLDSMGAVHYLAAVESINKGNVELAIKELKQAVQLSPKEAEYLALLNEISQGQAVSAGKK